VTEARVSSEEVAAALHVGPAAIRKYARAGRIPFVTTPGGHRRYDLEAVRAALARDVEAEETVSAGEYDDVADPGPKAIRPVETDFLGIEPAAVEALHPAEWEILLGEDGFG
jgi:excisionase family DNA binding protein